MKKILTIISLVAISSASAQLVTYNFTGAPGDQVSQAAATVATNATASVLTRGSGITAAAAGNSISSTGFSLTTIDLNDYYSFTITPDAGFTLDVGTLTFAERRSNTGIRTFTIRTSTDSFASNTFAPVGVPDNDSTRNQSFTFGSTFDAVASPLTIRIYGYAAEGATGTWRLANTTTTNMQLTGIVTVIPEPHEYALMLAGLLGLVIVLRRVRSTRIEA